MWRMGPDALAPDPRVEIGRRHVPEEVSDADGVFWCFTSDTTVQNQPMYVIINLGLSSGFTTVNFDQLKFPATMRVSKQRTGLRLPSLMHEPSPQVDYIRIWQPEDRINVGCDRE